jgi:hypothetical protein
MVVTPTIWRPTTQVNTTDAAVGAGGNARQFRGQIVGRPDGGYLVVWQDGSRALNDGGYAIMGQTYDALGARVGGEVWISDPFTGGEQILPAIAALPDGGFAVAFQDQFAGGDDIWVRRVTAGENFIHNLDDSAATTVDPSITSFADGSYVVAYTVGSGADTDIAVRRVSATGVRGAQEFIHNESDNSVGSELATLSNGNFVAVFVDEFNGGERNILFRILQSNLAAVTASTLVSFGTDDDVGPDVAALRDGGFVVVWTNQSGGPNGDDVRASIYTNGGSIIPLGGNILVPSTAAGDQNEPDVVALADGGFVVTWEDDTAGRVRGQRFDAGGHRLGSEFVVRNEVAQDSPEAALLTSGRFAYAVGDGLAADSDVMTSVWDFGPLPAMDLIGDLFWRHVVDGDVATTENALGVVPNTWTIFGSDDFDGDGDNDILWRHVDGQVVTWEMEGGLLVTNHSIASAGGNWRINGTGDFDGDGDADILWRHTDGPVVTWEMQDGDLVASHGIASAPSAWRINGVGDFDADGDADILWRHSEGAVVTWEMDDGAYVTNHNIETAPTSWQIRLVGDFDGDGDGDLLWRHSDGGTVTWEMEDGDYLVNHDLGVVDPAWRPAVADDFDHDGDADMLWRHSAGDIVSWEMEAGALVTNHNLGIVPSGWQIAGTGVLVALPVF